MDPLVNTEDFFKYKYVIGCKITFCDKFVQLLVMLG